MKERAVTEMQVVFREIEDRGFPVRSARALEIYGGEGDWHTLDYAHLVASLEVWEADPSLEEALRRNLPDAKVVITDSVLRIRSTPSRYDIVVVDNPQSVYGQGRYCEHFPIFPHVFRVCGARSVIIVNVNLEPYDLHAGTPWHRQRMNFYRTESPEKLDAESVERRYRELAEGCGFTWESAFFVPRNSFISYFCFTVARRRM